MKNIFKHNDCSSLDRQIKEMKLKKDLHFLKERFFKSDAALGRMFDVSGKVIGDWLERNYKMHDRTFNHVLKRLHLIKKLLKDVDNYDPEKFFFDDEGYQNKSNGGVDVGEFSDTQT